MSHYPNGWVLGLLILLLRTLKRLSGFAWAGIGINLPIGVSWSNKTDLLPGTKIGAQVGLSYNFSSLAGLFTGGQ